MRRKPQIQFIAYDGATSVLNSSVPISWNINYCSKGQLAGICGNGAMLGGRATGRYTNLLGFAFVDP